MSKTFMIAFAVGIGLSAVIVTGIVYKQRGARVGLTGQVLKVRTAALDENSSIAVIDFRFTNPSNVRFDVRNVYVFLDDNDGKQYQGQVASEGDAKRLFDAVPLLGQKYNDTLKIRDQIAAQSTADRMVAVRFEAPESRIERRKRFLLRIEDVDGASSEISEK